MICLFTDRKLVVVALFFYLKLLWEQLLRTCLCPSTGATRLGTARPFIEGLRSSVRTSLGAQMLVEAEGDFSGG